MIQISSNLKNLKFISCRKLSKKTTALEGQDWNNLLISYDEANKVISKGGNVAVVSGTKIDDAKYVIIIDTDLTSLSSSIFDALPETYLEKTPNGGLHAIFFIDEQVENKELKLKGQHAGELRAHRQYVVIAPSEIINDNHQKTRYTIIKDVVPATITKIQLNHFLSQFDSTTVQQSSTKNIDAASFNLKLSQLDDEVKRLLQGDITGYSSRSEAEQSLVNKLVARDFNKDEIFHIMSKSLTDKWSEKSLSYREMTYNKAASFVTEKKQGALGLAGITIKKIVFQTADELMKKKFPKNNYIIEGIIERGQIVIVYGESGVYKSFIILAMAESASLGKKFLNHFRTKKSTVAYLDKENEETALQKRLGCVRRGMKIRKSPRVIFITDETMGMLDNSIWRENLISDIKEKKIDLLVFDTMHRFSRYKENDADEINNFYLDNLYRIARIQKCATILIHHAKKDKSGYRGSSDIIGMADNMFCVEKTSTKDVFKITSDKFRDGAPFEFEVKATFKSSNPVSDKIDTFQLEMVKGPAMKVDKQSKKNLVDKIVQTLPNLFTSASTYTLKQIVKLLENNKIEGKGQTLRRAIDILIKTGKLKKDSKVRGGYIPADE